MINPDSYKRCAIIIVCATVYPSLRAASCCRVEVVTGAGGVFFTGREQLGEGAKTTAPVYYAYRWDIQPSDTAAYLRGEKVKPTKQIVFYIDNTFPEKWKPYLREGVTQWNELFEQIGFKDVVAAKDYPTDDP